MVYTKELIEFVSSWKTIFKGDQPLRKNQIVIRDIYQFKEFEDALARLATISYCEYSMIIANPDDSTDFENPEHYVGKVLDISSSPGGVSQC